MSRGILSGSSWSNQDTLAVAGTAQMLALGAETATFAAEVRFIRIYSTKAIYIAKDSTEIGNNADGGENCREYIPGSVLVEMPWVGVNVYFVDVSGSDTPTAYVTGHK